MNWLTSGRVACMEGSRQVRRVDELLVIKDKVSGRVNELDEWMSCL